MDVVDLIVEKRKAIITTCQEYGATNVRVFGSCARDDYHAKSDIDLLVDFPGGYDFGTLCELQHSLEMLLGRKVDLGTEPMLRPRIKESVLSEAVAL
ncbi:MAG: nucleotidyltransferase family protein [Candidatus Melainabacteria bacterium]|nr:nucleotidyltransferase family protein [Candidatus Melainabacteria bacterium]